ncbi:hypothetical protein [Sorangium sp. So ce1151]|uniref:hypothetical protein n=1 Tax=Sorangium sp. So ce1151 TaxID=3133332 RepID=UPI003F60F79A
MADPKLRPTRPSEARAAVVEAARQFTGEAEQVPLKIMVTEKTRLAFRRAAAAEGVSLRRMLLRWAREAGVEVDPVDLAGDRVG